MIKLEVFRKWFDETTTEGELHVDGQFFCYTLEDTLRAPGVKVPKETCIPPGCGEEAKTYVVTLKYSPKHGCVVPHIEGVPMFEFIEVHWGNKAEDTDGCLLVGATRGHDFIGTSRATWDKLMAILNRALLSHEAISITYTNVLETAATA